MYIYLLVGFLLSLLFLLILIRSLRPAVFTVGFFHPYADAGGGGERVLWHSVGAILEKWRHLQCLIITGDRDRTDEQILEKASSRFGINLPKERVKFAFLRLRFLVEAKTWPRFTLLGQCIGSVLLGLEALLKVRLHIYFDTMGYAFTYPLFRWVAGCPIVAYVHYPIVSTDMLTVVQSGSYTYNNSAAISRSKLLTAAKIRYYRLLALMYGFVGRRADRVMVNSRWTYGHIYHIWKPSNIRIIYPPCDVETFTQVHSDVTTTRARTAGRPRVVSVGQYRPEKNQRMQLEIIQAVVSSYEREQVKPLLVIIGSCRDDEDRRRVEELKSYAEELKISNDVEFLVNISFSELQEELSKAIIGLHTMWNEHFGISLVECMAAGCIMIAHRSGGPLMDIISDIETGYLADTVEGYAKCIETILNMNDKERNDMVRQAKSSVVERFSVKCFEKGIKDELCSIINELL